MAIFKANNNVTLLHKGLGPTLFQYRSQPIPVGDLSSRESPKCSPRGCQKPPRRIIVKCLDRQDENSMFTKRLQARDKSGRSRPPTAASTFTPAPKKKLRDSDPFLREKMFSVPTHKVDAFPPPSFLPRWNPRHKDRTYLEKMILDDPWSLPKEKRIELQRKTGLRLKSMSRHYQFKVGANLPFGKEALDKKKCHCYIEFCDHCSKSHDYRCPLHMQLLEGAQADCKTELGEECPFSKNPEDLPLKKIKDASVYVSEVVRRLRAGEIQDVPPFPSKLLLDRKDKKLEKTLKQAAIETSSAMDLVKKVMTESSFAQTEPFMVDVDMSNGIKDNVCQTMKHPLDCPMMVTKTKPLWEEPPYISYGNYIESSTQVTPFEIVAFDKIAGRFSRKLANTILQQSIKEVHDETVLYDVEKETSGYVQQLSNFQRTEHFRLMQEQFRNAAYGQEEFTILNETMAEMTAESNLGAIMFSSTFFRGFFELGLDSLRDQGLLINEDLIGIQSVLQDYLNSGVEDKFETRDNSIKLLDEITKHALEDLEIDYFMRNMVDQKYLYPINYTSRQLIEMIRMRDDNLRTIEKIKYILSERGWRLNEEGRMFNIALSEAETSESDDDLGAFLKKVRVSVDEEGNPKYLVDSAGQALPINVVWLPFIEQSLAMKETDAKENPTLTFDIVLSEQSYSNITEGDMEAAWSVSGVSSSQHSKRRSSKDPSKLGEIDVGFDDEEAGENSDEEDPGKMLFRLSSQLFKDEV